MAASARTRRTPHLRLTGHTDVVSAVTSFTTQDGQTLLATASHDHTVRIWDPSAPESAEPIETLTLRATPLALSALPDGALLVGLKDGWARLRLPETPARVG